MTDIHRKRVIDLDPFEVRDETLAALKEEIHAQTDDPVHDIQTVDTFVLDINHDGGLDSHATLLETVDAKSSADADDGFADSRCESDEGSHSENRGD